MAPTNKPYTPHLFILCTLIVLNLAVLFLGSVTLVWIRQNVSRTAANVRTMETDLTQYERKSNYYDAEIAARQSPEYLRKQALALGMQPRQVMNNQVILVRLDKTIEDDLSNYPITAMSLTH